MKNHYGVEHGSVTFTMTKNGLTLQITAWLVACDGSIELDDYHVDMIGRTPVRRQRDAAWLRLDDDDVLDAAIDAI